jgi:hypothetical protein
MSQSSEWILFIARPGNNRWHLIRDPQREPRIIVDDDDGTRINDRLARYIVDKLNAGLSPIDPNPDEGWFVNSPSEGDPDPAVQICDPDFETRIEILATENHEEDMTLGQRVVALINTYFLQNEEAYSSTSYRSSQSNAFQSGSKR